VSDSSAQQSADFIVDIRELVNQQGHRKVFGAYQDLEIGNSIVVLTHNAPQALRKELDRELAGAFRWEVLPSEDEHYRVRITKRASTALPRIVTETSSLLDSSEAQTAGSIWQLEPGARDLDSNIISLPAGDEIAMHIGPDLDVLILVLGGSGELETELDTIPLSQGALLWLPRKAQRRFAAGSEGLQYLTVHQRKPTLNITAAPHH